MKKWLLNRLLELEKKMAIVQSDIDALTAKVNAQDATLKTVETEVAALVAANQAAGNPLDLTALQAAITSEGADVDSLNSEAAPAPVGTSTDPTKAQ